MINLTRDQVTSHPSEVFMVTNQRWCLKFVMQLSLEQVLTIPLSAARNALPFRSHTWNSSSQRSGDEYRLDLSNNAFESLLEEAECSTFLQPRQHGWRQHELCPLIPNGLTGAASSNSCLRTSLFKTQFEESLKGFWKNMQRGFLKKKESKRNRR